MEKNGAGAHQISARATARGWKGRRRRASVLPPQDGLESLLETFGVDVVFSGHDPVYIA